MPKGFRTVIKQKRENNIAKWPVDKPRVPYGSGRQGLYGRKRANYYQAPQFQDRPSSLTKETHRTRLKKAAMATESVELDVGAV